MQQNWGYFKGNRYFKGNIDKPQSYQKLAKMDRNFKLCHMKINKSMMWCCTPGYT